MVKEPGFRSVGGIRLAPGNAFSHFAPMALFIEYEQRRFLRWRSLPRLAAPSRHLPAIAEPVSQKKSFRPELMRSRSHNGISTRGLGPLSGFVRGSVFGTRLFVTRPAGLVISLSI